MTENNKIPSIGELLSPTLENIEKTLLEYNGLKPNYPEKTIRSICVIFSSMIMDKMYDLQEYENMDHEDRINMTKKTGEEIRAIVKRYTNIDTFDLFK